MATITDATTLNAERQGNSSIFGSETEDMNFSGFVGTLQNSSVIIGTAVRSTDNDTDLNLGQNSIIFIDDSTTGGSAAGPAATQWQAGTLRGDTCSFVFCGNTGSTEWPGYNSSAGENPYRMIIPNCTFRTNDQATGDIVTHFSRMAADGNNLSGVTFENGQLVIGVNAIEFVNLTYSPDSASDGSVGGFAYRRANIARTQFDGTTIVLDHLWGGDFGCDFTNWNSTDTDNGNVGAVGATMGFGDLRLASPTNPADNPSFVSAALETQGRYDWYVFDGTFSTEWQSSGILARSDRRTGGLSGANDVERLPVRVITGRSFNPHFRERDNTGTNITDAIFDSSVGQGGTNPTGTILLGTTADRTVAPTIDTNRYLTAFDGNTRRTGFAFIEAQGDPSDTQGDTYEIPVRTGARNFDYWSFTHECYTNGAVDSVTVEPGTWTSAMVLDNTDAGTQKVDIALDAAIGGRTLADATSLVINGISAIDAAYPALKSIAYNQRLTEVPFNVTGTTLNFGGNVEFSTAAATTVASGLTSDATVHTNATWVGNDIVNTVNSTGTTFADAQTVSGMRFLGTTDFTNATLAVGNSIGGTASGLATNAQFNAEAGVTITYPNTVTEVDYGLVGIPAGGTINVQNGGGALSIAGVAADAQARFANPAADGTTITFTVPIVNFGLTVQQSAQFGATSINFDGLVTAVIFDSSDNSTVLATSVANPTTPFPLRITDTNRQSVFFQIGSNELSDTQTLRVFATGDKWSLSRIEITNTTVVANQEVPILADNLFNRTATAPTTINAANTNFDAATGVLTVAVEEGSTLDEAQGNALAGLIRNRTEYAEAISFTNAMQDIVRFESTNTLAPTFSATAIQGTTEDNVILNFQGGSAVGGNLADLASVQARVWDTSQGATGAQPSAIRAELSAEMQNTQERVRLLAGDNLLGIRPGTHNGTVNPDDR